MARGKHAQSAIHKANDEAQARIAELEAEVERLRSVENVATAHVQALGEIERLTRRLVELSGVAADRDRLQAMYDSVAEQAATFEKEMADRATTHAEILEIAIEAAPAGLDGRQRIEWLATRLGQPGRYVNSPHLRKLQKQGTQVPQALINRTQ